MDGELNKEHLQATFDGLIKRHESLRTLFETIDGEEPVQKVTESVPFKIAYFDGTDTDTASVIKSFIQPFDLNKPPLLRAGILKLSPNEFLLMTDMPHIICDGVSQVMLLNEFMALYQRKELPELLFQYKDYVEWQQSDVQLAEAAGQKGFWLSEFSEEPVHLDLPIDYSRPEKKSYEGITLNFEIDAEETSLLKDMADTEGVSMFMLILSISNILLAKLSDQEDIVIGIPMTWRQHVEFENIMGIFVNTLPLRNYPRGELSFREFLKDLKARTLACFDHPFYPFEDLIDELKIERDNSRNPLFEFMISYQNFEEPVLLIQGLELQHYPVERTYSKFDLSLLVFEVEDYLLLLFEYSTALFREETIKGFAAYFNRIVSTILADINIKISDI
jgi:hypothetical protein